MAKAKKKAVLTLEERLEQALVPGEDQPYPVPENWLTFYFTSLIDVQGGTQPPKSCFSEKKLNGYVRLVQIRDFASDKYTVYVSDTPNLRHFEEKDILIARYGASLGRICTGLSGVYNVALAKTIFSNKILNSRFVYWLLQSESFQSPLMHISRTAQAGFNKEDLSQFAMPLPPLNEQQRIVDRIESLFAKLDEAKEKAQAALNSFEIRKAAILHKAFTGELTAKWRKENGVGLDSWTNAFIKDLGSCKLGKMLDSIKNEGNYTKYLRNINVRWFDFELSDIAQMKVNESEMQKYSIRPGDLFICEGGEPGRCAVWVYEDSNMIFQKALHRFRPYKKTSSFILAYYFLYLNENGKLQNYFTGTTIKHLTGKSLAQIPIHLPTPSEQAEIVRLLDSFFAKEQKAKERCSVLDKIDLIKKSILARAFRGELGTNDPTEESAIELLKSIV